jgi:hypothetical protein
MRRSPFSFLVALHGLFSSSRYFLFQPGFSGHREVVRQLGLLICHRRLNLFFCEADGMPQIRPAEVRPAEGCPVEVRSSKVCPAEVPPR